MKRFVLQGILTLCPSALAVAQNPLARMPEVRQAITRRDSSAALALLDTVRAAVPDHVNVAYLGAHVYGLANRTAAARAELLKLASWDGRYLRAALRDTSMAGLRPEFALLADSLVKQSEVQVAQGAVWATVAERDLVPEGTAWDPGTRSVLISSLNRHKIVAVAQDGSVSDRVPSGASGLRSVAGIHVDTVRGTLWAASNARYDTPSDSTPSALFAFDSRTGAFRKRVRLPAAGKHFLNDITTGPDGTVYVTDTEAGKVWYAKRNESELRELTTLGKVIAPNGITISSDGGTLFVADVDHVRALSLATGRAWRVGVAAGINVTGIDGLAFIGQSLIAHHPLSFWRIARYRMDPGFQRIESRELLEANTPDGRTSTTGEVVGDGYVYIGNSQIDRMNLKTLDAATMDPVRLYRIIVRPDR